MKPDEIAQDEVFAIILQAFALASLDITERNVNSKQFSVKDKVVNF